MSELIDHEFGAIPIKRVSNARYVRLRLTPQGTIVATLPRLGTISMVKKLLESSRPALRKAIAVNEQSKPPHYRDGARVGASHTIIVSYGDRASARAQGQHILWTVSRNRSPDDLSQQDVVRAAVRKALDREAKAYLPRRLRYLADQYGMHYTNVRYSNAKGRWGSCSSRGVISLNVALMNLPMELIDYVLIHELSHTLHLNHSPAFWSSVEQCYPDYKVARKQLKSYSPYL